MSKTYVEAWKMPWDCKKCFKFSKKMNPGKHKDNTGKSLRAKWTKSAFSRPTKNDKIGRERNTQSTNIGTYKSMRRYVHRTKCNPTVLKSLRPKA